MNNGSLKKEDKKQLLIKTPHDLTNYSQSLISMLRQKGYLACSIDSTIWDSSTVSLYITQGDQYYWSDLSIEPTLENSIKKTFLKENKPIQLDKYNQFVSGLVSEYRNNGYPFCQLKKEALIQKTDISMHITIQPGIYYQFDSLQLTGTKTVSANYIAGLTGIKAFHSYNEECIREASKRIGNTGFLALDSLTTRIKNPNLVTVLMRINTVKTNSFTGILGIQPDDQHKTQLTGNVALHLVNSFKQGELIELIWNKTSALSQELSANAKLDFIGGSPFGTEAAIHIEKFDSLFTSTQYQLGLSVFISPTIKLSGYSSIENSNGNTLDPSNEYPKTNHILYGIRLTASQLDYAPNPSHGFALTLDGSAGNKTQWDSTNSKFKSPIVTINSALQFVRPGWIGVIAIQNKSGALSNQALTLNELYHIGGLKTMRGFNDNSIYCRWYSIFTLEYRWLFNKNSSVYIFNDFGYFSEPEQTTYQLISRYALGAGLNISTKAGILSIAYSLGKLQSNPISINQAKIHIGYINYF